MAACNTAAGIGFFASEMIPTASEHACSSQCIIGTKQ